MKKKRRKNSDRIVRGTPLRYNASQQAKYKKALVALVEKMAKQTEREITKLFGTPTSEVYFAQDASVASQARIVTNKLARKFDNLFGRKAPELAERMIKGANQASNATLKSSLKKISEGLVVKNNLMTGRLREVLKATVAENVALIKSIAQDYQGRVQKAVLRSVTSGNGLQELMPELRKFEGISYRKARFIALDQTRKTYNNINANRMQKVGVQKFEWVHSGGGDKPREDHIAMSGNIYSFDDPPVIDEKTGERGLPGQAPGCKCIMQPVYEFNEEESE
jgi:SPP1 gp7 family putative phage head morphogenesis protein